MGNFDKNVVQDLEWFYRYSAGDLGLTSSLGAMINMAMSGVSQGGGNTEQNTRATFERGDNSPSEKWTRIIGALCLLSHQHNVALKAHYTDRRGITRAGESPEEHTARVSNYGPAERCFGEMHGVVTALGLVVDMAALDRHSNAVAHQTPEMTKAQIAELKADVAAQRKGARLDVERVKAKADAILAEAHAAYLAARPKKERPPTVAELAASYEAGE